MCIHRQDHADSYNTWLALRKSSMRIISLLSQQGDLIAAWPVKYSDSQRIANTIRDLKNWHPEPDLWVDLRMINEARIKDGLEALDNNGLPFPVGEALPQDMDVDLVLRDNNGFTQFEKGLQRYVEAQNEQVKAVVVTKVRSPVLDSIQVPVGA